MKYVSSTLSHVNTLYSLPFYLMNCCVTKWVYNYGQEVFSVYNTN